MKKTIFALGFFDGVHLGHQTLLYGCSRLARNANIGTAAITFDQHPQSLFTREPPLLINTTSDRCRLLQQYGMDKVYTYPVNEAVMHMPWQDFLEELVRDQGAAGFVCGYDFRFGHKGEGNAQKLRAFCAQKGLSCLVLPEQTMDGVRVSSTHIRSLLEQGKMETACKFLGHPHILSGKVIAGRQLGRTIGVPTANLSIPEGVVVPASGVYACRVLFDGKSYCAVTNVGSRPTVEGHQVRTESWILDFEGDLYGRTITLEFHYFLRPEKRFASLEQLSEAVRADAARTRNYFRES